MSKYKNLYIFRFFLIWIFILIPSFNSANEILIYADSISYDDDENIIARGNAKIFQDNKLILSDLIIINRIDDRIILPTNFTFKDEKDMSGEILTKVKRNNKIMVEFKGSSTISRAD